MTLGVVSGFFFHDFDTFSVNTRWGYEYFSSAWGLMIKNWEMFLLERMSKNVQIQFLTCKPHFPVF